MLPTEVQQFVSAIKANASQVWDEPDDKDFIEKLTYVSTKPNGDIVICDNFERFYDIIYIYRGGKWFTRRMYSDMPEKEYTFEQAMSDASIMYTG